MSSGPTERPPLNTENRQAADARPTRVAARLPRTREGEPIFRAALARAGSADAVCFDPKDTNELNDAVKAGKFGVVHLASLHELLEVVWQRDIDLEAWDALGVRVLLADGSDPRGALTVARSYSVWWRVRSRHKALAAAGLSIAAVVSFAWIVIRAFR